MNLQATLCRRAILVAFLAQQLLSTLPADASFDTPPTVNPATNTSPSGSFVCEVDPSDLYGRGEAIYRLLRNGTVIWAGKKPFTLVQAGVTDDGVVAGYGYTHGENGFSEKGYKDGVGEFVVAIIDAGGSLRQHEVVHREASRFLHDVPNPLARGVIVDGPNNRFVVRVRDTDINRSRETWWAYELSSGKRHGKFDLTASDGGTAAPISALPVAATPLILVHYWRYEAPNMNARFALLDPQFKEVWSTTWQRDYNVNGDEAAEDRLREQIWGHGAILNTSNSNHFDLFSARISERVSFSVRRAATGSKPWVVVEEARTKHQIAGTETQKLLRFQTKSLKLLGMFALQEDRTAEYEVFRNVIGFCFDERGRIGLLRRGNDKHQSFALVDNEGTLIRETSLAKATKAGSDCTVKFTWAGGDRWVVTASELGPDGKTAAWWLDAVSGQLEPVSGFTCPAVKSLIGSGDGGFVALVVHHYKYTMEDELITFDKVGKPRWQIKQDYQNDHALFSPEDITLTSRRQVAVLDNIQHRVQFFDFSGKYASTLHLEKAWGRKPNYPSEICAERNGGILIYDFQGSPPIVRMNGDGKLVSQFRLKHPDGRVIDPTYGVKVSPSGHVWACDGASLVRVTDSGVADLVLGSTPGSIALGGVACLAVDQRGQLYAADERSGAVHIFDQDGKRLRVCTADVADFSKKLSMAHIGIGENGEIFLSSGDSFPETARYIHFGADGKRLGVKQLGLDTIQEKWYPLPTQGRVLVLGYHDAFIVRSEGKVLRKIERRPDGNWLEHPELASVAPNGSFAIVSGGLLRGTRFIVNLYSPEGEPIRTVVLPSSCMDYCFAFTGKYLATCTESEIRLFSPLGEPVFSFQYPLENLKDHLWVCFATQGGRELWMVSAGLKKVCRFELQ